VARFRTAFPVFPAVLDEPSGYQREYRDKGDISWESASLDDETSVMLFVTHSLDRGRSSVIHPAVVDEIRDGER
jgi:hypothetical protein